VNPLPASAPSDPAGGIVKRAGLFAALAVLLVIFALTYWPWMGYMSKAV
jgi:hypothetical protein